MELFLDPGARTPLTGQLYEQLRRGIAGGRLLPGDQLTPSRQLAAELGVSRHTVTTAYGRLTAEGYTLGHAGGGRWPSDRAAPGPPVCRLGATFPDSQPALPVRLAARPARSRALPGRPVAPPGRRR